MTQQLIDNLARQLASKLTLTELADGTGVLLDLDGHQVLSLNETALFLVQAITRDDIDLNDLAESLSDAFQVEPTQAREDAIAFLHTLANTLGITTTPPA